VLTDRNHDKCDETRQKSDGSDGSTPHFPLSFPLRKKREKKREDGEREKAAATPAPPSLRHNPNLLEGEL
jgi:hypothetical protein